MNMKDKQQLAQVHGRRTNTGSLECALARVGSRRCKRGTRYLRSHLTQSLVHVSRLHSDLRESLSSAIALGYDLLKTASLPLSDQSSLLLPSDH